MTLASRVDMEFASLEMQLREARDEIKRLLKKNIGLRQQAECDQREIERLQAERDRWNTDARRLSGGLMAIRGAAETVPASVLRSIAYDIALNCIEPDTAEYQISRRAALEPQP